MDTNTDTAEIKNRGRPRKYATTEEAHQANLKNMRGKYAEKNPDVRPGVKGKKPTKTLEEIREANRNRQKKYYEKQKEKINNN
jgi:DNA-binding PadR family transcriptional regulator